MDKSGREYYEARMALVDSATVKQHALDLGFTTVGIAPAIPVLPAIEAYKNWLEENFHGKMAYMAEHEVLKSHPKNLLPSVQSVIVVTLNYFQEPRTSLKIARYALGRDYHKELRSKLRKLESCLRENYPEAEFRACVDSAPILERTYAQLAGLGWFGKNTMLIDSKRGSWFFIGALLTSIALAPDSPSSGGCGTCNKCVEACPTGAIVRLNDRWQIDARSCISYQTIEKKGDLEVDTHGWLFGCDICQEVCPFNEQRRSQPMRANMTDNEGFLDQRTFPSLREIVEMDYDTWDKITRGSAIRRAGYEGLKRNARSALTPSHGPRDE